MGVSQGFWSWTSKLLRMKLKNGLEIGIAGVLG